MEQMHLANWHVIDTVRFVKYSMYSIPPAIQIQKVTPQRRRSGQNVVSKPGGVPSRSQVNGTCHAAKLAGECAVEFSTACNDIV